MYFFHFLKNSQSGRLRFQKESGHLHERFFTPALCEQIKNLSESWPLMYHNPWVVNSLLKCDSNIPFLNGSLISELWDSFSADGNFWWYNCQTNLTPYAACVIWIPLTNEGKKSKSQRRSSGVHRFLWASIILLPGEKTEALTAGEIAHKTTFHNIKWPHFSMADPWYVPGVEPMRNTLQEKNT